MNRVELYNPDQLSRSDWELLQDISRAAHLATLVGRTPEEIDTYLGVGEFERFYVSHLDPNTEVGRRYLPNQEYTDPRVAITTVNGNIVSWTYGADNVSGADEAIRAKKRRTVIKNHFWLRESATLPEFQEQGFASDSIEALTAEKHPFQDVRTYIYRHEMPYLLTPLQSLGFKVIAIRGEVNPNPFGEGTKLTEMLAMRALSARLVSRKLRKQAEKHQR
jgi:hypothetical protein